MLRALPCSCTCPRSRWARRSRRPSPARSTSSRRVGAVLPLPVGCNCCCSAETAWRLGRRTYTQNDAPVYNMRCISDALHRGTA